MKRKITMVLALFILLTVSACSSGSQPGHPAQTLPPPSSGPEDDAGTIPSPLAQDTPSTQVNLIALKKSTSYRDEWNNMSLSWRIKWDDLIVEDGDSYPLLSEALHGISEGMRLEVEAEADMLSSAHQNTGNYCFSDHDRYVYRADEHIVSIRQDHIFDTGGSQPSRMVWGTNLDTMSGKVLELDDVMTDTSALSSLLLNALEGKYPDFPMSNSAQILSRYIPSDYSWTMSYQGITFYFQAGEITDTEHGLLTATLWYSDHPDLFVEKYTLSPDGGYAIEMPRQQAIDVDITPDDGHRDVLSTEIISEVDHTYLGWNISVNGNTWSQDDGYCFDFQPHLVCRMADGTEKFYLYLFALVENDYGLIFIYDLNGNTPKPVEVVGGATLNSTWDDLSDTPYRDIFNDPSSFVLCRRLDILGTVSGIKEFSVNVQSGKADSQDTNYVLTPPRELCSRIPLTVQILPNLTEQEIPVGTRLMYIETDGVSYVDAELSNGTVCRIHLDEGENWPRRINGIAENDCFDGIFYAG